MLNLDFHTVLKKEVFQALIRCGENLTIENYLVGGFVRDHLLGKGRAKDIDVVAIGSGIELAKAVQKQCPRKSNRPNDHPIGKHSEAMPFFFYRIMGLIPPGLGVMF